MREDLNRDMQGPNLSDKQKSATLLRRLREAVAEMEQAQHQRDRLQVLHGALVTQQTLAVATIVDLRVDLAAALSNADHWQLVGAEQRRHLDALRADVARLRGQLQNLKAGNP